MEPTKNGTAQKVKFATTTITSGNLQKLAARFTLRFGWGRYRNEKPSKHLDFNDHQVVAIRQWNKTAIQKRRIDERLIANFDQVSLILRNGCGVHKSDWHMEGVKDVNGSSGSVKHSKKTEFHGHKTITIEYSQVLGFKIAMS